MPYKTPDQTLDEAADITIRELNSLLRKCAGLDQYLTVAEAATYIRGRKATIYGLIKDGKLSAYAPTPGKMIVRKNELEWYVKHTRI